MRRQQFEHSDAKCRLKLVQSFLQYAPTYTCVSKEHSLGDNNHTKRNPYKLAIL